MLPITIAVLCSGYITYRYNLVLNQTRDLVHHSLDVTTAIGDLMIDLQDLETGQRGYLITGDQSYLSPFQEARDQFDDDLNALENLVGDNAEQMASADTIVSLVREKLDEMDQTIQVRRDEGFDAAREIVASDIGKQTMDSIRTEIGTMRDRENRLLTEYTDRVHHTENHVIVIVAITIVLSLIGRLIALLVPVWWRRRPNNRNQDPTV
jgi:CHASE3 domain sensor protein